MAHIGVMQQSHLETLPLAQMLVSSLLHASTETIMQSDMASLVHALVARGKGLI